jgi:hypothetical protein
LRGGEFLNFCFQFSAFERGEFVEEWQDDDRRDEHNEELNDRQRTPRPKPGVGYGAENPEDEREDRRAEQDGEQEPFDNIQHEGFRGGFVETVAFFDDEGVVDAERNADELSEQNEDSAEDESLDDHVLRGGQRDAVNPLEPAKKDEGDGKRKHDSGLNLAEPGVFAQVALGFGVFFGVVNPLEFVRYFSGNVADVEGFDDEV